MDICFSAQTTLPVPIEQSDVLSVIAKNYLDEVLDVIQKNSVKRNEVDWDNLRQKVFQRAQGATSVADTYEAIRLALFLIEDGHSGFISPEKNSEYKVVQPESISSIKAKSFIIDSNIGYLLIPSFHSLSPEALSEYASNLQQAIAQMDHSNIRLWMIDLCGNSGGSLIPMMMGLAPFFDPSEILKAFGLNDFEESFFYDQKSFSVKETPIVCSLKSPTYRLKNLPSKIALLVDRYTGSSGEAVAIAFLGMDNVKVFGERTAGCTTANVNYTLPDGAEIILAYNYMRDLKGRIYKAGIIPHEQVSHEVVEIAKRWLKNDS